MTVTPRERAREQTLAEITRIGREHLATHGAAALSLRAVARDLGVVSSAVYRYVASRDELLTLLVVDGYTELGAEVNAAVDALPVDDHRGRLHALARAVRAWAVREPARYALLFGSPVPGYHAPAERTTGPGTRVVVAMVGIVEAAYRAGAVALPEVSVDPGLAADLDRIRGEMGLTVRDDLLARGVMAWAALFGAVNFEVFGQYGADTFADPAALFEHHLVVLDQVVGLA
ncbi:TetR/AcrR family transcriptional regulator [Prescottella agglutinans]|uniref:TetR/AcrR family transcriptional regulator n=1 Tax=Prescottella agglutinans TaxID=1644129 RepID=A0A438B9Q5_9NOCA|nr:TetR/AcrR family transcriptional regulator [Prescottella agglutinans]RVW07703.1 TetR/AcrR family transcriptional regulator [Prescottella agglutinans]